MQPVNKSGLTNLNAAESSPRFEMAFGEPRNFLDNRFIYLVVSQRARGLSIGVNMNPDQLCNFHCVYCEVKRATPQKDRRVNIKQMTAELKRMLSWVQQGSLQELACYRTVPEELLQLREIALSGDGEPTLCPNFSEVVQALIHTRATAHHPFFKVVLITNGTCLDAPEVQSGLRWFTDRDEIWVKLDVGTQEAMDRINRSNILLENILRNILNLARQRPVVIQSLFPLLHDAEPSTGDIDAYVKRLSELKAAGAQIALVQIYSAHRPTSLPDCRHLSLQCLSRIAHRVREEAGLEAEVF